MLIVDDFINGFTDYLISDERLPRLSGPYEINKPYVREDDLQKELSQMHQPLIFQARKDGKEFGWIWVEPYGFHLADAADEKLFQIAALDVQRNLSVVGEEKGYGREFLRRIVLYAYDLGFERVETSRFMSGAATFWYNMCFNNKSNSPRIYWKSATSEEKAVWKKKLKESPANLWELARTEVGHRILHNDQTYGILNLRDKVQMKCACERLRLPLPEFR